MPRMEELGKWSRGRVASRADFLMDLCLRYDTVGTFLLGTRVISHMGPPDGIGRFKSVVCLTILLCYIKPCSSHIFRSPRVSVFCHIHVVRAQCLEPRTTKGATTFRHGGQSVYIARSQPQFMTLMLENEARTSEGRVSDNLRHSSNSHSSDKAFRLRKLRFSAGLGWCEIRAGIDMVYLCSQDRLKSGWWLLLV